MLLPSIGAAKKKKKNEEDQRLRVIELNLFPPTPKHYPRFDYEAIRQELGFDTAKKEEPADNTIDFRDQDADEIVRRLEAKYSKQSVKMTASTASASKKPKKHHKKVEFAPEDVMDKGLGYDLEDDFIDDEQPYDEWVPTTMDTAKHGHYVNKGQLDFRQIDLDASSSSSSESEESNNNSEKSLSAGEEEEDEAMEIAIEEPSKGKEEQKQGNNDIGQQTADLAVSAYSSAEQPKNVVGTSSQNPKEKESGVKLMKEADAGRRMDEEEEADIQILSVGKSSTAVI